MKEEFKELKEIITELSKITENIKSINNNLESVKSLENRLKAIEEKLSVLEFFLWDTRKRLDEIYRILNNLENFRGGAKVIFLPFYFVSLPSAL